MHWAFPMKKSPVMNSGSPITRQPHNGKIKLFANDLMKRPSRNGRFLFACKKNSRKKVPMFINLKEKILEYIEFLCYPIHRIKL